MNGYHIIGSTVTVGEGFDILSLFSGFLGGGQKKETGPSPQQQLQMMQMQQDAQRAREAAARANTMAWTVGGVVGAGALGLVLWKVLGR